MQRVQAHNRVVVKGAVVRDQCHPLINGRNGAASLISTSNFSLSHTPHTIQAPSGNLAGACGAKRPFDGLLLGRRAVTFACRGAGSPRPVRRLCALLARLRDCASRGSGLDASGTKRRGPESHGFADGEDRGARGRPELERSWAAESRTRCRRSLQRRGGARAAHCQQHGQRPGRVCAGGGGRIHGLGSSRALEADASTLAAAARSDAVGRPLGQAAQAGTGRAVALEERGRGSRLGAPGAGSWVGAGREREAAVEPAGPRT